MALRSESGYSLSELMVVVAIIAVVTAIAMPAFNHYSANSNLKAAARDLASDLFAMREKAVAENREFMVEFSTGTNSYTLNQGTYSGEPWTMLQTKTLTAAASDITLTEVAFNNSKVAFTTRGLATPAGHLKIANRYNSIATITVNFAGRTHVSFEIH